MDHISWIVINQKGDLVKVTAEFDHKTMTGEEKKLVEEILVEDDFDMWDSYKETGNTILMGLFENEEEAKSYMQSIEDKMKVKKES